MKFTLKDQLDYQKNQGANDSNKYKIYYLNNDAQRVFIDKNLSYMQAVELCQKKYKEGLICAYIRE